MPGNTLGTLESGTDIPLIRQVNARRQQLPILVNVEREMLLQPLQKGVPFFSTFKQAPKNLNPMRPFLPLKMCTTVQINKM